jgi:hypothetical protein
MDGGGVAAVSHLTLCSWWAGTPPPWAAALPPPVASGAEGPGLDSVVIDRPPFSTYDVGVKRNVHSSSKPVRPRYFALPLASSRKTGKSTSCHLTQAPPVSSHHTVRVSPRPP